jgi:hypothetical protein
MIRRYACPALLLLFAACTKGDKVPAYVLVQGVTLQTDAATQGSARSNVTDAWIYADDELIGVWELPALVPVLKEGAVKIEVAPAVKRNGMFDDRVRYPFYTSWSSTVDLVKTQTRSVAPMVQYNSSADFWIEAFEDAGHLFHMADTTDELIHFTAGEHPELDIEGNGCRGFVLDGSNTHIRFYTDEDFPTTGGPMFLEVDYASDITLTLGVMYALDGLAHMQPYVYIAPSKRADGTMPWKKIYIDLSPVFNSGVTQRDIYFEASLPSGQATGTVYLDNIKLVY